MTGRAWHLLCDLVEYPLAPMYADCIDQTIVQELADEGLIAIVRSRFGWPLVRCTPFGAHEYRVVS